MKINIPNKIDNINYFKLTQRNCIYIHRHGNLIIDKFIAAFI